MGLYGAVIGGIAGGIGAGVASYLNNKKLASSYKDYANDIRKAAEKYSGHNADEGMKTNGMAEGLRMNSAFSNTNQVNTSPNKMTNALNKMNNTPNYMQEGNNLGRSTKANELNSKYNSATAKAQQALNQANINYQATNATTQGIMNGVSGLADMYNTIKSDERIKESLPQASVEDALRQINSVEYKYKPETGLDQDRHVGVTAQSLENTAFDDVVKEENGIKELDKNKLLEAVMSGIAALQKEIDELEGKNEERQ